MNFTYIDPSIRQERVVAAARNFQKIIVELGVRETNKHVGSGLGGNNFQLLTLMNLKHSLVKKTTIQAEGNSLRWGAKFLQETSLANIRHHLDDKFLSILERNKYLALPLQIMADYPEQLRQGFVKYQEHFPQLTKALQGRNFTFDPDLSLWEMLVIAYVLCQDLAKDLDAGITNYITSVAIALDAFSPEIVLLSVRKYIGIERLVHHNLDEHVYFSRVIVNKIVD
jgi:hypothetical protein